jgi:hypothetical protein
MSRIEYNTASLFILFKDFFVWLDFTSHEHGVGHNGDVPALQVGEDLRSSDERALE